jgi:para-aminobenzoate synthetase
VVPVVRRLEALYEPERVFHGLYADSPNAFWLDSSAPGERGRFSFVGDSRGPLGALVTYDVEAGVVRVESRGGVETHRESIFDFLAGAVRSRGEAMPELPFDFDCGFAGYFGYELKAECDGRAAHSAATPDAAFVFADRLIAFDHLEGHTYLLALGEGRRWAEETERRLADLPSPPETDGPGGEPVDEEWVRSALQRPPEDYMEDIARCKRHLAAGHSYEICLTNQALFPAPDDPLYAYRRLRRANPAPFSAYLRFGGLAVLSSSPERFLRIGSDGSVEARPIKGTSPRGRTAEEDARLAAWLANDGKTRAENVTIVDLLRNDLGRVCEFGSVEVTDLLRVESYETVHQLVSAVRGRLRPGLTPTDCVRACFPPGSMTGAPKRRTMEILDGIEGRARGVYSGAIGYLGLGGGCDLSVAIRMIAVGDGIAAVGAGGAIVAESDPGTELREVLLKAKAPSVALAEPQQAPLLGTNL